MGCSGRSTRRSWTSSRARRPTRPRRRPPAALPEADLSERVDPPAPIAVGLPYEQVAFAHNSERQFARLLDFYRVRWEYEPHTFVLERGDDGSPTWAFSPDFYLPDHGRYIEVTTLNQKLVTKKNRKVRLLQERYPEVRIKVLYQRDYLALLVKYGLEPPSQSGDLEPDATRGGVGPAALSFLVDPPS